ncbi:hypothetical protein ETAA8_45420 [Anatilimnocola aggregata]|uniref:Uncharacterized protein n=1 Tax=Anatilimnocola aggregata TaxID=2528021 RepID=A0A517YGX5_9BACT|nr:hypothetical protein ETAA8_45420 [Anatilimnocola aggregata]
MSIALRLGFAILGLMLAGPYTLRCAAQAKSGNEAGPSTATVPSTLASVLQEKPTFLVRVKVAAIKP